MSKERLIKLFRGFDYKCPKNCLSVNYEDCNECKLEQLADYLLASGEVLVPPCKVGDKVYHVHRTKICEGTVVSIHQNLVGTEPGRWIVTVWFDDYYANSREAGFECGTQLFFPFDCFEKDVFLKREKAEAKLKKSEDNA